MSSETTKAHLKIGNASLTTARRWYSESCVDLLYPTRTRGFLARLRRLDVEGLRDNQKCVFHKTITELFDEQSRKTNLTIRERVMQRL
jgi:hypothetical protein